jgi:hypothetical protein
MPLPWSVKPDTPDWKVEKIDQKLPVYKPLGRKPTSNAYDWIMKMQVGECIEVNRSISSTRGMFDRAKKFYRWRRHFVFRKYGPKTTRIWRV